MAKLKTDVEKKLQKAIILNSSLSTLYNAEGILKKRQIIGSMFPEKLTFTKMVIEPRG